MFERIKVETVLCLLMMAGALWITKLKYENLDALNNGREVIVNILEVPRRCGEDSKSSKAYFKFSYLGKVYRKDFRGLHCDKIAKGKAFTLLTNSDNSKFVFKEEGRDIKLDITVFAGLAIVFLILAVIGQRKKDKA